MRRTLLLTLAIVGTGCGPERRFSGVWQQACAEGQACPDGKAYELHVGRYGDAVTGLLVRYASTAAGLDPFDAPNECGCFYLASGKADEDGIRFTLFEPDEPGAPSPDFQWSDPCTLGAPNPPSECESLVFALEGDEEQLAGTVRCEGRETRIEFLRAGSSPRRTCIPVPLL